MSPAPELSVVVPIHQEEPILRSAVQGLLAGLRARGRSFELILAENGSRDVTLAIARALEGEEPEVIARASPRPDYGAALRDGILAARGTYVLCEEIDLCDADFHGRALALLDAGDAELVVGSKAAEGAQDLRPPLRRAGTRVMSELLRASTGFRGTDTHGLKAFRRSALLPVVERCVVGRDLFASELVVRAQREGLRVVELPITIEEKRPPSRHLLRRVPRALLQLGRLAIAVRRG